MNTKFIALIRNSQSNSDGFATVVALGIGLTLVLIGAMMMTRSQADVNTVSSQGSTAKSLANAETGLVRFETFIYNNRPIATYPACGDSSFFNTGTCTDNSNPSWFNSSSIPNASSSSSSSSPSSSSTTTCSASPSPSPSPSPSSSSTTTSISSAVSQNWQNIDPADASKGQYRLIDYTYANGVGTLTVEGRAGQQTAGTAINRLAVTIPITSVATTSAPFAGLWAQDFKFTNTKAQVAANVLDSSGCSSTSQQAYLPTYTGFSYNLPTQPIPTTKPYPLSATASTATKNQIPFPPLPGNTYAGQIATIPAANINNKSCISSSASTDVVYPQPGDVFTDAAGIVKQGSYSSSDLATAPSGSGTYFYRLDASCGGKSISFSSTGGLKLGTTTNQNIILFLDGQLNTSNTGGVSGYTDGSGNAAGVIIYSNANISITNGGSVTSPEKLQIYNYGSNTISLTNTGDIRGFIFAPNSTVNLTNKGSIVGAVWAQSFSSSNEGGVYQGIIDPSQLKVQLGTGATNKLGGITSWNRQTAN